MRKFRPFNLRLLKPISFYFLPKKVLKFKRTKWKPLQQSIYYTQNSFSKFQSKSLPKKYKRVFNKTLKKWERKIPYSVKIKQKNILSKLYFKNTQITCKIARWNRLKSFFKEKVVFKRLLKMYFDNNIFNTYYLKSLENKKNLLDFIKSAFIQPEYVLSRLLWRLKFYENMYVSKQQINAGFVTVNNKTINDKYLLKCGDIIKVNINSNSFLQKNISKLVLSYDYYPFVEIDYYTNNIIIIYDLERLHPNFFNLIMKAPLNIFMHKNVCQGI